MAIMGRSMVETVSIILSAEEGKGEGRVVLAKPTIQTDIEHFFLLLLCKVAKASILDAFTSPLVLFNPGNERPPLWERVQKLLFSIGGGGGIKLLIEHTAFSPFLKLENGN